MLGERQVGLSTFFSNPGHSSTGKRGYFGKLLSSAERRHNQKTEPRAETIRRANWQLVHRPGVVGSSEALLLVVTQPA
jgi:hypothetical protein